MTKTVVEVFWYKEKFAANKPSQWWRRLTLPSGLRLPPSLSGTAKRSEKEILFGKIEESQILITQSINFIPKNAMKLHFTESFAQAFREPQR